MSEAIKLQDHPHSEAIDEAQDKSFQIEALSRAMAVIEFDLEGHVIQANDNFLHLLGYDSLDEIKGKHHRIFCEPSYVNSLEYEQFWNKLRMGDHQSSQFKRFSKTGKEIWIEANYTPIIDSSGKTYKVLKFANDITQIKEKYNEMEAIIEAIHKSQGVIEFDPMGNILGANQNFLSLMGYTSDELMGSHHRMFCDESYASSQEYQEFWKKLRELAEYDEGEYLRFAKGGRKVWIRANYNPILDLHGKVRKVVKIATDLTKEKEQYNFLVAKFEEASVEIGSAAEELTATASQMGQLSENNNNQATLAAKSSEDVAEKVRSVVSNTEEMTESVNEISKKASETSNISNEAKSSAENATLLIDELSKASLEINSVIKLIQSIAQQTNLLALNATIEAARAGDAGRGFSVVASEVKELANQTSKATNQITEKIQRVSEASKGTIDSIGQITSIIEKVFNNATSTASATEEQAATTAEVTRKLSDMLQGVEVIVNSIQDVAKGSLDTKMGANDTLTAAQSLSKMATGLSGLIHQVKEK